MHIILTLPPQTLSYLHLGIPKGISEWGHNQNPVPGIYFSPLPPTWHPYHWICLSHHRYHFFLRKICVSDDWIIPKMPVPPEQRGPGANLHHPACMGHISEPSWKFVLRFLHIVRSTTGWHGWSSNWSPWRTIWILDWLQWKRQKM